MKKNLSKADRIIRLILAAILVAIFAANIISGTMGIVLVIAACIISVTSLISFCPIYWTLNLSSAPKTK